MRSPTVTRGQQRAFTLLELMIAMALLGVTMVLVFDGLRLGTSTWNAVDRRVEAGEQMRLAQAFLRRELEQAQAFTLTEQAAQELRSTEPTDNVDDQVQQPVSFDGGPESVKFVAPLPNYTGQAPMYWVTVELQGRGAEGQLVVSYKLFQQENWESYATQDPEPVVLQEKVEELKIEYFGQQQLGQEPGWQDSWGNMDRLPALVRLRLRSADGGESWPELVVAPRVAAFEARSGIQ